MKIYDFDHGPSDAETKDWNWLRSIFGDVQVHPIEDKITVNPGDIVYKVVWLNAKRGNTSLVVNVRNVGGQPIEHETVMWGWPDAPPHGYAGKPSNWSERGVPQDTNANGDAGPGMGTGSYYDPATERGAHEVWVWDLPSDFVDGLGMISGTFHDHVEIGYRAVIWGEEPPPPPEPPTDGELLDVVREIRDVVVRIEKKTGGGVPPEPPADTPFHGEYFNNTTLDGVPILSRDDEEIDFAWESGSPDPKVNANDFSVRWVARKTFDIGTYTFHALTDDGLRLWVDGDLLIDAWGDQPPTPYEVTKVMSAGQHDIRVEYYERGGGATCKFWWDRHNG